MKNYILPAAPRLRPLKRTYVRTLFQPAGGTIYAHQNDGFFATFLPSRNVIIVEAKSLDGQQTIKKVCQVADFNAAVENFPGESEPGLMGICGRGVEGIDAARDILGVVIEEIDNR